MDTISELQAIRNRVAASRGASGAGRIMISMGICGVAAGARQTLSASTEELEKRRLADWEVVRTGCLGLCEREPIMIVEKPGEPRVVYYGVTEDRARQIIVNHLVNNYIVGDWVLPQDETLCVQEVR